VSAGLVNGLDALLFLAGRDAPASAREVAMATGIPRATAYRLLADLAEAGWVAEVGNPRGFVPTFRVAELGLSWMKHNRVRDVTLPHLIELARHAGRVCFIAFYDRGDVFYTDAVEVVGDRVMPLLRGERLHPATTASGKVVLAFQDQGEIERVLARPIPRAGPRTKTDPAEVAEELRLTRERGYALSEAEHNAESSGVAAPVFDQSGGLAAAIGVVGPVPMPADFRSTTLELTRQAAARASAELGYRLAARRTMA
jgi:DNA-binding IclR family transcriptional regulator